MKQYDYLIVGCGLSGSTFARLLTDANKKVLIIDSKDHIAGACYTKKINNIEMHMYGPHIFYCNDSEVWDFMNRFTKFNNFTNRVKAIYKDKIYSLPFNMMTFNQLWGVKTPQEARKKLDSVKEVIKNPKNLEEQILSIAGREIYETFVKGYTEKQWMRKCTELKPYIINRLPFRLTYDDNYFNQKYQGIPEDGYTNMIFEMISNSDIILKSDFLEDKDFYLSLCKNVIYTGKIDQYFDYKLGELEYRTLDFLHSELPINDFQGNAVVNYTEKDIPYTRITEHKHFSLCKPETDNTIITYEYPAKYDNTKEPYYPIDDEKNIALYNEYKKLAQNEKNTTFIGRADYKYHSMESTIKRCFEELKNLKIH